MADILLEAVNIGKSYGSNVVLKDVNFQLAPGQILGLVGENGAGKSTLSTRPRRPHTSDKRF